MDLPEQAIKIWPNINKALEKGKSFFVVQTIEHIYLSYQQGVATIDQTDLHIIVEYLRSKDAHIYWSIAPENLDTTFYGQSLSQSLAIKNIIKLAVNGDNLLIGTIEDFIAEHLEDLLEAFKGIRFNEIKIGIELADEDLRVIRDATRATIYYKEKGVIKLFEPEN